MQRSTKIVATLGPASNDREVLTRMIAAGVDVVRMNFSHGSADEHLSRAELVREAALGYISATSFSTKRQERAVDNALDWIRRGLALNRVAVFVALLQLEDDAVNEQLAGLRGRLSAVEAAEVWCNFADCDGTRSGDFIVDWRAWA